VVSVVTAAHLLPSLLDDYLCFLPLLLAVAAFVTAACCLLAL